MKSNHGLPEASSFSEPPAIAIDGKRRVVFVNSGAEEILGVRRKEVLGSELSSVLSRDAMSAVTRSATLRIPGAVPRAERTVYILDPAALRAGSCPCRSGSTRSWRSSPTDGRLSTSRRA